jgi:hypothetical protein
MTQGLVVIEGHNVGIETFRSLPLMNAKPLPIGKAPGFGIVLHLAANSLADFNVALAALADVSGVSGVLTLALPSSQ